MPRDGSWWLDEYRGKKVRVVCDQCGLSKQYDGAALFGKLGDIPMPDVRMILAKALGCTKTENLQNDTCQIRYADLPES